MNLKKNAVTLTVATSTTTRQLQSKGAYGVLGQGLQRRLLGPFSEHKEASTQTRVRQAGQIRGKWATGKRRGEQEQRQRR